jgi:hypothetical protein
MDKENHKRSNLFLVSIIFSIILHFTAILVVKYVMNLTFEKPLVNPEYIMITTDVKERKEPEKLHGETEQEENPYDKTDEPEQVQESVLDGVTFWASAGNYNPPPYIHLEVKEKYLFSENRYQYSNEVNDFTVYYNEPEELSGQVSQEVYCRTESENDFSIKLIIRGKEQFKSFQPRFFGMIKSFKFGKTLF